MRIVRAPLRVSLFGGGTDLDPYCSEHGSTIISFAIDSYIRILWNKRPIGGCRLSYSTVEELDTLKNAEHTLVRETARTHGIDEPCTMTIVSDLPAGTGLGSSSALAVCLAHMTNPEPSDIIQRAHAIEAPHSKAGWQDYFPAAAGGFRSYYIEEGGRLKEHWEMMPDIYDIISRYGLLLYTGASRSADSVLGSWQKSEDQLYEIKVLARTVDETIRCGCTPDKLAAYLNEGWQIKRRISGVTSPSLNRQYAVAMANGALGGKLCGAGAGGCWFFLVPPSSVTRAKVKQALGLREIPFKISQKGVESWEL